MTHDDKDRIVLMADPKSFPKKGFELACKLSAAHQKGITLLLDFTTKDNEEQCRKSLAEMCDAHNGEVEDGLEFHILQEDFTDYLETQEARAVIFELSEDGRYPNCKKALKRCRQLRIPYYFVRPEQEIDYRKVLVPIGFLVEEREKGVFCSGMGRFFHSEILLMTANDYGSRAKENTEGIITLLDKFQIAHQNVTAKKDSFKVEIEAAKRAKELQAGMLLISASREYGMDDLIFGPKEQKVIEKSPIPVMVINPRKDLYALCD